MSKIRNSVADALHYLKLDGAFYCKSSLKGNWGISMPNMAETSMFHIVTEGSCIIEHQAQKVELRTGDFVFLPKGEGHIIRSADNMNPVDLFNLHSKKVSSNYELLEVGDSGVETTMLCGVVKLQHPSAGLLIGSMPDFIHLEFSKSLFSDWMNNTVRLISREAKIQQVGGETILTRLADVLVIQVLRHWIETGSGKENAWLTALRDEKIGKSLSLIHSEPGSSWTLEKLSKEVGMSRTSFSVRFLHLVGLPMFKYLTEWRMNLAMIKLREGEKLTPEFMEELGYKSESAFRRTFKKVLGKNIGEIIV